MDMYMYNMYIGYVYVYWKRLTGSSRRFLSKPGQPILTGSPLNIK